jgi:hypothetical protein
LLDTEIKHSYIGNQNVHIAHTCKNHTNQNVLTVTQLLDTEIKHNTNQLQHETKGKKKKLNGSQEIYICRSHF